MKKEVKGSILIENIKRCYVGLVIKLPCPICGTTLKADLGNDYFSYPVIPSTEKVCFYCEKCDDADKDCEFILPVTLKSCDLVMEYDPLEIRKEI